MIYKFDEKTTKSPTEMAGDRTLSQTIIRALDLYKIALDAEVSGKRFIIRDDEKSVETEIRIRG